MQLIYQLPSFDTAVLALVYPGSNLVMNLYIRVRTNVRGGGGRTHLPAKRMMMTVLFWHVGL